MYSFFFFNDTATTEIYTLSLPRRSSDLHIPLELLARFGIAVHNENWQRFTIPAGSRYSSPGEIHVEADASSASYFIALGAIASDSAEGIRILGVGLDSIQGDIRFVEAARAMGAEVEGGPNWLRIRRGAWPLKAIDLDCNHMLPAAARPCLRNAAHLHRMRWRRMCFARPA